MRTTKAFTAVLVTTVALTGAAAIPTLTTSRTTVAGSSDSSELANALRRHTPSGLPKGGLSMEAMRMVRKYPQALTAARFYRGIETGDIKDETRSLATNWVDVPLAEGQGPGRAGFAAVLATYHRAFPDLQVHIDEIAVAGDTVTSRNTLTGTQEGPFLGVGATGRIVTFRTTDVHHVVKGRIRSSYHLEDLFGAYEQVTEK